MSGVFATVRRALTDWASPPSRGHGKPLALVYRGPASLQGCPEAVAELLESSDHGFDVRYVGPKERLSVDAETLSGATLYAQPGGGSLSHGYKHMRRHRDDIRAYVRSGGGYLGFCLGGYLAGATPGFDLLPGDTDQYIASRSATVHSEDNTIVDVTWQGHRRTLFFQDGPVFELKARASATVLATYPNKTIAALVTKFGSGRVGVVGPHPEAKPDWFSDVGLAVPRTLGFDLGLDLVDAVMKR